MVTFTVQSPSARLTAKRPKASVEVTLLRFRSAGLVSVRRTPSSRSPLALDWTNPVRTLRIGARMLRDKLAGRWTSRRVSAVVLSGGRGARSPAVPPGAVGGWNRLWSGFGLAPGTVEPGAGDWAPF